MVRIIKNEKSKRDINIPLNKRCLTEKEIKILEENNNSSDNNWETFYVDKSLFDPSLIRNSSFSGFISLGKIENVTLSYNDLHLSCGISNSYIKDSVIGDYLSVSNVSYLDNYHIGDRVILFNISEMCCTLHSKFGNGILKEGEPESNRIWIGVSNENNGRSILPFESMLPSDAYLWSHFRDDTKLLDRFVALTENGNDKKLNTYGIVENDCVIKNCSVIKDAKICSSSYIKGAFKLKNITILSSEEEVTQIGEGVELVNGIVGYGSRVFYQAIAVRFVIGRNCQVKYGARVLNSVLGDNSTVSCCEILNNLIFPFHEQHHNSSFLIAATIMGQSNIASGSTIGSNHNSRSADGEVLAKRGFWPGLCSDFKHNSRFTSFVLVAKGSYNCELNIIYPFSLVSKDESVANEITITPAWWFSHNMYAITRNKNKFISRDKRVKKIQHIEVDPLAPDTINDILDAMGVLIVLFEKYLEEIKFKPLLDIPKSEKHRRCLVTAKYILENVDKEDSEIVLIDNNAQKRYGAIINKPIDAFNKYFFIASYWSMRTLCCYCYDNNIEHLTKEELKKIKEFPLYTSWENVGGQVIPSELVEVLFDKIKNCEINTWDEVHAYYDECFKDYEKQKVRYSIFVLEYCTRKNIEDFTKDDFQLYKDLVKGMAKSFYDDSLSSREKDYSDYFRDMLYRNDEEKENVLGKVIDNKDLQKLEKDVANFLQYIDKIFYYLTN